MSRDPDETDETLLSDLPCLYCSQAGTVFVRVFRWNAVNHLACHCRNCEHRWQMRERTPSTDR